MRKLTQIITISAVALMASMSANAHGHDSKGDAPKKERKASKITQYKDRVVSFRMENIQLTDPRARTAKKGQNSAAFVKVTNTSMEPQKIVKASSPVANIVELHMSLEENGVHKMRPVKFIEAPKGGVVELKSGGYHVMLIDLKHDLIKGQEIPLTLEMENGNKLDATYKIKGNCGCCKGKKKKADRKKNAA